jgi:5S rRNA maturation endonuclease (ribonuclease M5)
VAKSAPPKPREVCRYDYKDVDGSLLYQVIRYEPKDFRVCRPAPDGAGCIWNLHGVKRVLYGLPNLTRFGDDKYWGGKQPRIFYVEGEKDVESLATAGLLATTHAGGASSWRDELLEQIPDSYKIVLVPDMDDPGKQLMRRIWNAAQNDGRDVQFVLLNKGKDVTEFFELGGTVQELEGLIT